MILDSSAIVKLVIQEPMTDFVYETVREAILRGEELSVPDIALSEALNALWKHHRLLGEIDEQAYREGAEDLLRLWRTFTPYKTEELALEACEIASSMGITIYDALYLALARRLESRLLTFDKRMLKVARALGVQTVV